MNVLSIGGSDPSSGAGIQSDVKTLSRLDAYGLTVITAITGQNTSKFGEIQPVSNKILKNQLDMILSDFEVDAVKIGMVFNSQIIKTIHNKIKGINVPIILDPIIKSTTGGMLIQKSAIKDFKKYLIPISTVITPNKFEAEFLTKTKINSKKSLEKTAKNIQKMGVKNVIITGVELEKNNIIDFVLTDSGQNFIEAKKIGIVNHGSGCTYSASLASFLAHGKTIFESAFEAHKFSLKSIRNAKKIGHGVSITQSRPNQMHIELANAINKFTEIKNISTQIPECQTNFVFAKKSPKSANDVLGISGRIVKTGNSVTVAGNLEYGGSKHVATAILTVNKKFEHIRSAINLKFQMETVSKLENKGFVIKNYDRMKEPRKIKSKEGSSIMWGIKTALKHCKEPPDVIYHRGDFGKEPMILIFGATPDSIIEKISKIL